LPAPLGANSFADQLSKPHQGSKGDPCDGEEDEDVMETIPGRSYSIHGRRCSMSVGDDNP